MVPVAAKATAGRRRGSGTRPLMGWGGGSASVDAMSLDAVPAGDVSVNAARGAMSSVAAKAMAAGRRGGSGT